LSILIPVYNVRPFLQDCLDSVAGQINESVEVIALDDASTDGSTELLAELGRSRLPRLRILTHSQNQGLSAARNHMLEAATGEYIWFLDSDDYLAPGAVATVLRIIYTHTPDLIACGYFRLLLKLRLKHRLRGLRTSSTFFGPQRCLIDDREALIRGTFRSGNLFAWARIFRREIHPGSAMFPVGRYFEDVYSTPRLTLLARNFYYEPAPLVFYRQRHGSIVRSIDPQKAADLAFSLVGLHNEFATALRKMSYPTKASVACFSANMFISGCKKLARCDLRLFQERHAELIDVLEKACPLSIRQVILFHLLRPSPSHWQDAIRFAAWRYHPDIALRMRV
jgi:glycosyltransferase involved in cell wall biosynthesis